MDAKITLSFNEEIIGKAKQFAESRNISLSRLTEIIYRKMTEGSYKNLEDFPIADWVTQVSEGEVEYKSRKRNRKSMKAEYFKSKKK